MLLSLGLGSAWGWGCVSGDRGDLLPEKTLFSLEKKGERVEKLLPVKFAAWLEAVEGLAGGCSLSPAQGLGSGTFGRWHFTAACWEGQKESLQGAKKIPKEHPGLEKKHLGGKIHVNTPAPICKGWAWGQIQGSRRNRIPPPGKEREQGGWGELRCFVKLLFSFQLLPRLLIPSSSSFCKLIAAQ